MGKKSKMSEEKDVKKGENVMEVCASTTFAPSTMLTRYGLSLCKSDATNARQSAQRMAAKLPTVDESLILESFKDVVGTQEELRIIGLLWIDATFPSDGRRGGSLSSVRDYLHHVYGPESAFLNARMIEGMLQRGILRYREGEGFFGMKEDVEDIPFLNRRIVLSPAFVDHVAQLDKNFLSLDAEASDPVANLRVFSLTSSKDVKKAKIKLLKKVESDITLKDHFLTPELAEQVQRAAHSKGTSVRERMRAMGVHGGPIRSDTASKGEQRNVILLYGPPGTGKTSAAYAIAGELNVPLYLLNVDSILSPYFGEAERNMRAAFAEYRSIAEDLGLFPVMLMDECDSLMRRRNSSDSHHSDRATTNMVNIALQEIAAFEGKLIMTTNTITMIDDAFARRIGQSIFLDYPPKDIQAKIWRHYLNISMPGADTINVDALLAEATLTGALIVKCVDETVERLLLRDGDSAVLTTEDLLLSVRRQLGSFDRTLAAKNADKKTPFGFV
jgi:adenylate kinase family enzyme